MHVVLVEPEIPGNTGSVARTCAGTDLPLHLVGKLGFSLEDRYLKRAGLDYWPHVDLRLHASWNALREAQPAGKAWLFTTKAERMYTDVEYGEDDMLVFGAETRGLPEAILEAHPKEQWLRLPTNNKIRSLNLANCATAAIFEALRQRGWRG